MIFVTVGTQLPFSRLVSSVDYWAQQNPQARVFAQIGMSKYTPTALEWTRQLGPQEFQQRMQSASMVVSHAGIGSIISALELGKPVLVLPRQAKFGEHRNDHQLATAERFKDKQMVQVAYDEDELLSRLDLLTEERPQSQIASHAAPQLLKRIRNFIHSEA
jgi:UDP-N-acetylglucosamine transferase subunit ALG13